MYQDDGVWVGRDLYAEDADLTLYWPDVRPCWEETSDLAKPSCPVAS